LYIWVWTLAEFPVSIHTVFRHFFNIMFLTQVMIIEKFKTKKWKFCLCLPLNLHYANMCMFTILLNLSSRWASYRYHLKNCHTLTKNTVPSNIVRDLDEIIENKIMNISSVRSLWNFASTSSLKWRDAKTEVKST
jgi:hypothetical protein